MPSIGQDERRIIDLAARVRSAPPSPALAGAFAALRHDEILGSIRLSGARLDSAELRTLTTRERAVGGHLLVDYLTARGYADAAGWAVWRGTQRGPISTDDLRTLHRRAAGSLGADAGAWRTRTLRAFADGTVPPAHWLVPFETATYVGRLALADDDPAPLAIARAVARLVRLQPFAGANGRVARLVGNLVAYRRGLPPLVLDARARTAFRSALAAALAGDATPLARVIARSLIRGLERLDDAVAADATLQPLTAFASQGGADRLYKAAQRGRLRVVRREGRLFTTGTWLAQYADRSR